MPGTSGQGVKGCILSAQTHSIYGVFCDKLYSTHHLGILGSEILLKLDIYNFHLHYSHIQVSISLTNCNGTWFKYIVPHNQIRVLLHKQASAMINTKP